MGIKTIMMIEAAKNIGWPTSQSFRYFTTSRPKIQGSLRAILLNNMLLSIYVSTHKLFRTIYYIRYNQTLTWHKTASAQSKSFLAMTFVSYLSFIGIRWTSVFVVLMSLQVTPI